MKMRTMIWVMLCLLLTVGLAHADLDAYLEELSISARGDQVQFTARLGARFDLPAGEVELVLSNVDRPADAFLVLWLGEKSHQSRERVLEVYRHQKGGWGAIARELGIKPGSQTFHDLKAGTLDFHPDERNTSSQQHGKKPKKGGKRK